MTAAKAELRRAAAARREAVHGRVDPRPALARLDVYLARHRGTGAVAFYRAFRSEIDPGPSLDRAATAGEVCLPVTEGRGRALVFRRWTPGAALARDGFGVEIPAEGHEAVPELLVVPMLAFDRRCHRLGYGQGHYDRTLAALRAGGGRVVAVGLAYAAQEVAVLPAEPTDAALDAIVTERELILPRSPSWDGRT